MTEEQAEYIEIGEERPPCREVLGGLATLILYGAGFSLPFVAVIVVLATPTYEDYFRTQELVLPATTKLLLMPAARWILLALTGALFGVFIFAWSRRRVHWVAILAPVLFALALALLGSWWSAMHPDVIRPGSGIHDF